MMNEQKTSISAQQINNANAYVYRRFLNMTDEEYDNLCHGDGLFKVADEAIEQYHVNFEDIEDTFNKYSGRPGRFQFGKYELSIAQTRETTSHLYHTIREFTFKGNEFFNDDADYRNHIVGKLKFFIDLYADMENILHINETQVIDNYYAFLVQLCPDFNGDDFSDVLGDYCEYIEQIIDSMFEVFDEDGWINIDAVLDHVSNLPELNFQEQEFIMDVYYSTCGNYKIMRDNGCLVDEVDYHCCRKQAAINDYCREHYCLESEIVVQEFDD